MVNLLTALAYFLLVHCCSSAPVAGAHGPALSAAAAVATQPARLAEHSMLQSDGLYANQTQQQPAAVLPAVQALPGLQLPSEATTTVHTHTVPAATRRVPGAAGSSVAAGELLGFDG